MSHLLIKSYTSSFPMWKPFLLFLPHHHSGPCSVMLTGSGEGRYLRLLPALMEKYSLFINNEVRWNFFLWCVLSDRDSSLTFLVFAGLVAHSIILEHSLRLRQEDWLQVRAQLGELSEALSQNKMKRATLPPFSVVTMSPQCPSLPGPFSSLPGLLPFFLPPSPQPH